MEGQLRKGESFSSSLGHEAAVEVVGNGPQQRGDPMEDHAGDIMSC